MATIIVIPGSSITATIPIKVVPSGVACSAGIILTSDAAGAVIKYTSPTKPFTATGVWQNVAVPIVVPAAGGLFYVWVAITLSGIYIGASAQDTTLTAQGIEIGVIIWS